jgi:predicted RNA-binding protein
MKREGNLAMVQILVLNEFIEKESILKDDLVCAVLAGEYRKATDSEINNFNTEYVSTKIDEVDMISRLLINEIDNEIINILNKDTF